MSKPLKVGSQRSYPRDSKGKVIDFIEINDKAIAFIGPSGCNKTSSLLMLHEHLDNESTSVIDPTCSVNPLKEIKAFYSTSTEVFLMSEIF